MEPIWTVLFQSLLIVMFIISASLKLLRTRSMVQHWSEYRYPFWGMYAIAGLEAAGAALMITAFWFPANRFYAAALFAGLMVGAVHAHLFRAKHKPIMAVNAMLMLVLSVTLLFQ
ncbi:DoxX family protein [Paenibacillus lactis]|uniref:DoxX family protein n=1 Tax=Paenibacillus lactis TaxID=228574 RepID=UPI0011A6AFBF